MALTTSIYGRTDGQTDYKRPSMRVQTDCHQIWTRIVNRRIPALYCTVLHCTELLTKEHVRRHVWRQIQGQEQEKGCSQSTLGGWVGLSQQREYNGTVKAHNPSLLPKVQKHTHTQNVQEETVTCLSSQVDNRIRTAPYRI